MEKVETLPRGNILSAIFLVAGTCIGGGMLALPVATGIAGFLPSMAVMVLCCVAMTLTALLLLEVSLWMEEGVHVITMSSRILGMPGKIISWILYLFICYASLVAYTAGGGLQLSDTLSSILPFAISNEVGAILFILLFGAIVELGSAVVGRVNAIFFIAMVAAYLALVSVGTTEVHHTRLVHQYWPHAFFAFPLMLTTFSFQTMVPSLTPYLKRHSNGLRMAIIGGMFITFTIYALWQSLILGIVPVEGKDGLEEAFRLGLPPTQFLKEHVSARWIGSVAEFFSFFAIITSFLGIGLGLRDFLADGLKIKNNAWGKMILAVLIVIPTLLFATQFERIFLVALEYSGGIGDSIMNGIIPVLMVWIGRYSMGYTGPLKVGGGKFLLATLFCFFTFTFIIQLLAYT